MEIEKPQVVFALLGDSVEGRKAVGKGISKFCNGKIKRIDTTMPLQMVASSVFGIPMAMFSEEKIRTKSAVPIIIKDAHLRRIVHKIYDMCKDVYSFNPNKIGLNRFSRPTIETPYELLTYLQDNVLPVVYPDFGAKMSYTQFLGYRGTFVIENVERPEQLQMAEECFQLVYPIWIQEGKKKDLQTSGWGDYSFFGEIKFLKDEQKLYETVKSICVKVEKDVGDKLEAGLVKPIVYPVNQVTKEKIKEGSFQSGNAIFSPKPIVWRDDEIIP